MADTLLKNPWSVNEQAYPYQGDKKDQLRFLLNYAVLAPSGHNTQPWLFRVVEDQVELWADRRRALPVVDPHDRELVMSCGAALFHLRAALRHFGYRPEVHLLPEPHSPDLLARVASGAEVSATYNDERMFTAIKRRRTNRAPFTPGPLPEAEIEHLRAAAEDEEARVHVLQAEAPKNALADLIAEGDRRQARDPSFRRELAAWLHNNRSSSRDGIPGAAFGFGDLLSYAGPFVIRTFDWGEGQAAKDRQLAEGSPALLVLTTEKDTPRAWMQAGQALGHLLLQAQAYDLQASYLNQPVEVTALRPKVQRLLKTSRHPQLILRVGYPTKTAAPTPRRPTRAVLLEHAPNTATP